MSQLSMFCMGRWDIVTCVPTLLFIPSIPCFFLQSTMSTNNIYIGTLNDHSQDHSKHVTVNVPAGTDVSSLVRSFFAEDVTPSEDSSFASDNVSDIPDSIIFTKKAKREAKIPAILDALKKSVERRRDKTRAFVDELHSWQKDGYVDAHYNAQVMYDELDKLLPLPFGYDAFKRQYNCSRV